MKNYKDLIASIEATHRDLKLEILFSDYEDNRPTRNVQFVNELRELLSTITNREKFLNDFWFVDLTMFKDIPEENFKEMNNRQFIHEIKMLYSEYKYYDTFAPQLILTDTVLEQLGYENKK